MVGGINRLSLARIKNVLREGWFTATVNLAKIAPSTLYGWRNLNCIYISWCHTALQKKSNLTVKLLAKKHQYTARLRDNDWLIPAGDLSHISGRYTYAGHGKKRAAFVDDVSSF